jgi:hypothetical protein
MENKKLVKILIKDVAELEELIGEIKSGNRFDSLGLEFIHTRAKGVLQLLRMLDRQDEESVQDEAAKLERLKEKVEIAVQAAAGYTEMQQEEVPAEVLLQEKANNGPELVSSEPIIDNEPPVTRYVEVSEEKGDEMLLENHQKKVEAGATLGESFLKGKSVNDLITDQVKLEFKLSNRPVTSIQAAIGINDRFQYIRELFDGDNKKFMEAVKTLDTMKNVKEAVEYLRSNFKWNKNETSLKFVNLVKRRFQD